MFIVGFLLPPGFCNDTRQAGWAGIPHGFAALLHDSIRIEL